MRETGLAHECSILVPAPDAVLSERHRVIETSERFGAAPHSNSA